ncbi:MAG: 4Fe-4S binding protein [Ignavibacteriales bacterium]|nr:4Fe-4S binding protein [Ignavibacteriales bacterium]MCB9219494.1 4Fe-4S binding protein [Ignavibacteriales bacterium]
MFTAIKKQWQNILIVILFALAPAIAVWFLKESPQHRYIHIENFRYGKNPSSIYCNRGDTLHLTFSSKDTGHSFFLEEFDMDVKVEPGNNTVLVFKASNPTLPPEIKDEVILVAKHAGLFGSFISKSNYRCHVWCGPMHAFEHGKLIIAPNYLLNMSIGLLLGIFVVVLRSIRKGQFEIRNNTLTNDSPDLLIKFPLLKKLIKKNWFQPSLMIFGFTILYIVLLTTLFGTQMSGRNLGVMLVWTVWLFLVAAIFTPLGGRLWCLACPLPMFGEFLQRRSITHVREGKTGGYRNQFFGLNLKWPKKLENGWIRLFLFLITGTLSTTLVSIPQATGIAILLLIIGSTFMSGIWELRSFCRYVCPINTFISLYSKVGKLSIRKADHDVCAKCKPLFCEKGSFSGWACPYGLNVREIDDNFDCGLCTECVRSCLYDNVALRWNKISNDTGIKEISKGWTALVMFILGAAYTILYLGHWPKLRDYVNILDKGNWDLFAIYTIVLWLIALIIFPAIFWIISKFGKELSKAKEKPFNIMISQTSSLLPIGLSIWIAFVMQMLFTNFSFFSQSLSDPFGWGWNLLGLAGTPWKQLIPHLIPMIQVIIVIFGFYYSIKNLWDIWSNKIEYVNYPFNGFLTTSIFHLIITCLFIFFYTN